MLTAAFRMLNHRKRLGQGFGKRQQELSFEPHSAAKSRRPTPKPRGARPPARRVGSIESLSLKFSRLKACHGRDERHHGRAQLCGAHKVLGSVFVRVLNEGSSFVVL